MAEASGGESLSGNVATSDDKIARSVSTESQKEKPTCILCLGMAGSGKTTFVQVFCLTGLMAEQAPTCNFLKMK